MPAPLQRRECLALIPCAIPAALSLVAMSPESRAAGSPPAYTPSDAERALPSQDPAKVAEMVGAAHRDLDKVRSLLVDMPQLANAAVDWGFGDWETALGAASHTGRRAIAELLIEHGARPDLFTFAMMGRLDAVRAILAADPSLAGLRGPHGLTLLSHARAGGEQAQPVAEFLATLPDADRPYVSLPLDPALVGVYSGTYRFGKGESDTLEVALSNNQAQLTIRRTGRSPRNLFHVAEHTFHPVGGHGVRIVFEMDSVRSASLAIHWPQPVTRAVRV